MTIFSQGEGLIMLILYGLLMVFISIYILKPSNTKDNYLVADRNVGFWQSGFSVAATWIWAPALFIATQKAYQQGIAGLFWFTVPNIACLIIFSYFAIKLREMFPKGYTLSQFILQTYSPRVQKLYLVELIGLAICQFAVQLLAGGAVISYLTGLDFFLVTLILTGIAFAYSFISGIRASILTDYWQMWLILGVVVVIVPWIVGAGGGFETIWNGLGGISGQYRNPFNFDVFYGFGIAVTIGLLAGPFGDQSFWQRAFSIKEGQVKKAFYTSAIVFGIVPILTGLIGFVAAGLGIDSNGNAQLINVITAQQLLPVWVLVPFTIMLLSGLVSTLDSSLCAISSLTGHDIATMFKSENTMWYAKIGMMFLAVFGLVIANIPDMKILYLFLFYGTLRASTLLPTVLTIWKGKLSESGVFWGICTALFVGAPMMAYGNFGGGLHFQVWGAIFTCLSSGAIAWFMTDANIKEKTLR